MSAPPRTVAAASRRDWTLLLAATFAFLLLSALGWWLPGSSPWLLPALLASVVAVAALVAVFLRMLRRTDELARKVISEALALAFVVTLAAMLVYPILQAVGFSPLRPQIVAAVLVFSFTAGIGIFSRRYE